MPRQKKPQDAGPHANQHKPLRQLSFSVVYYTLKHPLQLRSISLGLI